MSGFRPRFFVDADHCEARLGGAPAAGDELALCTSDSHHALHVLRLRTGDECEVAVGAAVYAASLSSEAEPATVVLGDRLTGGAAGAAYRLRVGLVQALTRPALVDDILEKGTEVGASFFVLVPAAGSKRLPEPARSTRTERWRRIVVEAAKQSKQSAVPSVDMSASVAAALDRLSEDGVLSLALEPSAPASLHEILQRDTSTPVALWTGPESGWSEAELGEFARAGIRTARLGQSILRAETAGPVAVAIARLALDDW